MDGFTNAHECVVFIVQIPKINKQAQKLVCHFLGYLEMVKNSFIQFTKVIAYKLKEYYSITFTPSYLKTLPNLSMGKFLWENEQ